MIWNLRNYLPEAEIECVCTGPDVVSARFNVAAYAIEPPHPIRNTSGARKGFGYVVSRVVRKLLRISREIAHWITAHKVLKGVDALIMPGTGLLVDYSTSPCGYPYFVFKWSCLAKLRGCKVLVVSMGAGPIIHPLSRRFIKFALALVDYRSYRDNSSREYLDTIGFNSGNDPVYPDLAFSLPRTILPHSEAQPGERPVVGVGLVDYHGQCGCPEQKGEEVYRNYLNKTGDFIKWLLANDYRVRLLIGDVTYDTPVKRDLLRLLNHNGTKPINGQIIDEPVETLDQLVSQLAKTDIVVSARFHNIVLCLMLAKPVIALSYTDKFDSLMKTFGLSEYCHSLETFEVGRLTEQFLKLEQNTDYIVATIKSKTDQCRKGLDEQYGLISRGFNLQVIGA